MVTFLVVTVRLVSGSVLAELSLVVSVKSSLGSLDCSGRLSVRVTEFLFAETSLEGVITKTSPIIMVTRLATSTCFLGYCFIILILGRSKSSLVVCWRHQ